MGSQIESPCGQWILCLLVIVNGILIGIEADYGDDSNRSMFIMVRTAIPSHSQPSYQSISMALTITNTHWIHCPHIPPPP